MAVPVKGETLREFLQRMRQAELGLGADSRPGAVPPRPSNPDEIIESSSSDDDSRLRCQQAAGSSQRAVVAKRRITSAFEDMFDSFVHQSAKSATCGVPAARAEPGSSTKSIAAIPPPKVSARGATFRSIDQLCDDGCRKSAALSGPGASRSSGGRSLDLLDVLDAAQPPPLSRNAAPVLHSVASSRSPLNPLSARVIDQLNRYFESWRSDGFTYALRCRALKITVAFHAGFVQAVVEAASGSADQFQPGEIVNIVVHYETFVAARVTPGSTFDLGRPFHMLERLHGGCRTLVASFCVRPVEAEAARTEPRSAVGDPEHVYDPLRGAAEQLAMQQLRPDGQSEFPEGTGREWFVPLHILQELLSGFEGVTRSKRPAEPDVSDGEV
jgi:hypothetical protein